MTIQSQKIIFETDIETYLPELNITLLRDQKTITNNIETLQSLSQRDKTKQIADKIGGNK